MADESSGNAKTAAAVAALVAAGIVAVAVSGDKTTAVDNQPTVVDVPVMFAGSEARFSDGKVCRIEYAVESAVGQVVNGEHVVQLPTKACGRLTGKVYTMTAADLEVGDDTVDPEQRALLTALAAKLPVP